MSVAKFENGRIVIMWASMLVTTYATLACGLANREFFEMQASQELKLRLLFVMLLVLMLIFGGHLAFLEPADFAAATVGHAVGWTVVLAAIVALITVAFFIFNHSMMDRDHGVPERGNGPDDIVAQTIGGHGHEPRRSHRTFGSTDSGHIAALASMMRGLVTRAADQSHFSLTRDATA